VVPAIRPTVELSGFLREQTSEWVLMLVEPSSRRDRVELRMADLRNRSRPTSCTLLIGPEGGWTADEVSAAVRAGFEPLTLGGRTWRADAVPVAAVAGLEILWGEV
jgi:RsmE family RNA methyltransferase